MVSLARDVNTSGRGAVFFDASLNMDEEEYLQPILTSQEEEQFKKLDTVCVVSTALVLSISLEIVGLVLVSVWPEETNKCDTYFIYLYLHCAYWLVVMLVDSVVRERHHKLRINGYFDFYKSTYQQIRAPLFVASLWNVCYLLLAVILHHTHKFNYEEYCRASEWFTPLNYIVLLTTLELSIVIPIYAYYIKRVLRFNRLRPPPDVAKEEWFMSFSERTYAGTSEVGCQERGSNLEELLEKQADLIRYFRAHNAKLSRTIISLMHHDGNQAADVQA